ncbi:MAG: SulP family inorganic anion transporter [Aestuariivirga sp.]
MPHLQTGFHPKFLSAWRTGDMAAAIKHDALAGLTVAVVALPLSMAIAIASHVGPERGLYSAIVGGFIISAFGGSRFQVGGPAGAFIVLVAALVDAKGLGGLLTAMVMAGVILILVGLSGFGRFIRYVPQAVVLGFSAGIAIIIFASQIKDVFGLSLTGAEPAPIAEKLATLWAAHGSFNLAALGLSLLTIALIEGFRKFRPMWPGLLIAVVLCSVLAALHPGIVETIASKFGGIPSSLPKPTMPDLSLAAMWSLLPAAFSFALLAGIESLLSALVADGMTGRKHRSSTELMAQGLANVVTAFFGGIVCTGLIARTATNIRAGARTPLSGILHSVFILAFMLVAAPLAGYIPLAALAGVLVSVCWHMADKAQIGRMLRDNKKAALVMLVAFGLTVFVDLTTGIVVSTVLAFVLSPKEFLRGPQADATPH